MHNCIYALHMSTRDFMRAKVDKVIFEKEIQGCVSSALKNNNK